MNCASLFSKKTVFVIPNLPTGEQILEDLSNVADDDISFKILNKDDTSQEKKFMRNSDIYQKMKIYLHTREHLKQLYTTLAEKEKLLEAEKNDMECLARNLRQQAQEALNT